MSALQESRRELMVQLEGLMRLLKVKLSPASNRIFWKWDVKTSVLRIIRKH